jgi:hypothetical protein
MSPARALWVGLVVFCAVAFVAVQVRADEGTAPAEKPAVAKPAKTPAEKPAAPDKSDAAKARAEKVIADVTKELTECAEAEGKIATAVMQADTKATEMMKDKGNLTDTLEKNDMSPGTKEYKAAYLGGAAQLMQVDKKYSKAKLSVQTAQKDAKILPDDTKSKLDDLLTNIAKQRRANYEKMATWYKTVADYKDALNVDMGILKDIPEDKRAGETTLQKEIKDLQAKLAPNKGASGNTTGKFSPTGTNTGTGGWTGH